MHESFFRIARERAKLTQFDAAVRMGVTTSAVSGWERGQCPSLKMVDKIVEVYGVKEAELLRVMKEMSEPEAAPSK